MPDFHVDPDKAPIVVHHALSVQFAVWRRTFANSCLFLTKIMSLTMFESAPALSNKST